MYKNKVFALLLVLTIILSLTLGIASTGCGKKTAAEAEVKAEESTKDIEDKTEEAVAVPEVMTITPEETYKIISEGKDYIVLDVRTPEEYAEGHIEGAILIPVDELENRLDELPADKPVIVYCRSGNRSSTAANILIEAGFKQIYDMGGITNWINEGYTVITGN